MNRKQEIETRLAQIRQEMEQDGADLDALTEEVRTLKAELDQIERTAEQRRQLREAVAGGAGTVVRSFGQEQQHDSFGIGSEEYRTAWLKHLRGQSLTEAEQRAYTASNGAISTLVVNDIMSVVRDHAPLLQKITLIYSNAKITYYVEGTNNDAQDHTENATISAAADTLTPITLDPKEVVKLIQISETAKQLSIPAFNAWLVKMLGEAIARKINSKIISAISTAASSSGTTITTATVQALLGAVKGTNVEIICNRSTLYTKLLPLQDNSKSSIVRFDGGLATVYGIPVNLDDNAAADTVLAGDLTKVAGAMGESIAVRQDYDINTNSYKYLGVALFEGKVALNAAFGKLTQADSG